MALSGTQARLYLNGKDVGSVLIRGSSSSWGYGEFHANDQFSEFAILFGQWSLLMHADDDEAKISPATSEELRRAEYALDTLRARLVLPERKQSLRLAQVNIDGPLIEWKMLHGATAH